MAISQHVLADVGGTIYVDVIDRPTNALVTIRTGTGAVQIGNATATVDSISTVSTAALIAGDVTLTVDNAAGISSGVQFWVRTPDEKVRCKTVNGNAVTLWHPVLQAHANAVTVEGARVTYTVPAANASPPWWDGRAEWWLSGSTLVTSGVECTKYELRRWATAQDLYAEHPLLNQILDTSEDAEKLLDHAHDDLLSRLAGKMRVRVFTGSANFIRATVFSALANHYRRQQSDEATRLYERYKEEFDSELARIVQATARDEDQGGSVEANEAVAYRSTRLYRR